MSPGVLSITNTMAFLDLTNPGSGGGRGGIEPGKPLPFRFHGVLEGERRGLSNYSGSGGAGWHGCMGEGCVPSSEEIARDKVAAEVHASSATATATVP